MAVAGCSYDMVSSATPVRTAAGSPAAKVTLPPLPAPPVRPRAKTTAERVQAVIFRQSTELGVELTSSEWSNLSEYICNDRSNGGQGLWTPEAAGSLAPEDQNRVAELYLDGAILSNCPEAEGLAKWKSNYYGSPLSASLAYSELSELQSSDHEYQMKLLKYNQELIDYSQKHHVDTSSLQPLLQGGGSGYRVRCNDGTVSQSGGKQGACSHHGGVNR